MSIEAIPTGAAIGAEIRGINLVHPLDDATFAAIEKAYNTHGVILFRSHCLTPPQQVAFTRRFGEIGFDIFGERWSVPDNPEIVVVQYHGGKSFGGSPPSRRELAQRHVLQGAAATRHDALRDRDPRATWRHVGGPPWGHDTEVRFTHARRER